MNTLDSTFGVNQHVLKFQQDMVFVITSGFVNILHAVFSFMY